MRAAVKVRDGLPIIGLWSRLTATGGVSCSFLPLEVRTRGIARQLRRSTPKVRDKVTPAGDIGVKASQYENGWCWGCRLWNLCAGGVGTEELMYPEYCRNLIDSAPEGFDQAVYDWEQLYKPVICFACAHADIAHMIICDSPSTGLRWCFMTW